ncbi:MAG: hypothetical protein ACE5GO_01400 [Anaerolineales bacterium]
MQTNTLSQNGSYPTFRNRFHAEAYAVAGKMVLALRQRNLSPVFQKFILTETQQNAIWLIGVLDQNRIGKIDPYGSESTLHQISTLVGGKPTIWSNTSGVRYAVLLAGRPQLPELVPFPDDFITGVLPLGVTLRGSLSVSWQKMRNALITGTQGTGKSVFLTGAANIAMRQGYVVYLADPEQHTFSPEMWDNLANAPVAYDEQALLAILRRIAVEMKHRNELYRDVANGRRPPRNLEAYNQLAQATGKDPLPRLVLIVDEANDFFDDKSIVTELIELARHGRKWGLNIILAAHNWRAKDVPRNLSGRFPVRIAFHVDDDTSARVVLDDAKLARQAMKLNHPGRGIIRLDGKGTQVFQAYYLSEKQEDHWQAQIMRKPSRVLHTIPTQPPISEDERRWALRAIRKRMEN